MRKQTIKSADTHYRAFGEAKNSLHANTEGALRGDNTIRRIPLRSIRNPILVPPIRRSDRSLRPRIRSRSQKPRTSIGTTDRNGESNPIQKLFRFSVRRRFHRRDVRPRRPIRAHALQTESRTAHRSIGTSQKGTGLLNLILIKTGTNMFAVLANVDFLPVLKHRDSGIGVVPVVRVSLTVASSRRGEMESYTVSARV